MKLSNEQLLVLYAATGEETFLADLIEQNMGYISNIAWRFRDSIYSKDDAMQDGVIGLIEAIKHYDPKRKVKFLSYAHYHIIKSIQKNSPNGRDQVGYLVRNIVKKHPGKTHEELFKIVKKHMRISRHSFNRSISPNLNVDVAKFDTRKHFDLNEWEIEYDVERIIALAPKDIKPILTYLSQGYQMKDIAKQLKVSRQRIDQRLQKHLPTLKKRLNKKRLK